MLQALRRRKVRWFLSSDPNSKPVKDDIRDEIADADGEDDSEREGYTLCEDTLTAMVFSRLSYLPSRLFWQLISDACIPHLPQSYGEIESSSFWPRWILRQHGTNSSAESQVEPDLILRFREADLLVEAKRRDGFDLHRPEQLTREWRSWSQLPDDRRADKVLLLAVSGFRELTEESMVQFRERVRQELCALGETVTNVPAFAVAWASLRKAVESAHAKTHAAHERILLEDILSAFDLHGVLWEPPSWFADFGVEIRPLVPVDLEKAVAALSPQKRKNA